MREEILSIASDLREGHISSNEAKHLLLVLFGVGRSEQLLCDDCLSDGMDKVLRKENNCLSCTQKIAK